MSATVLNVTVALIFLGYFTCYVVVCKEVFENNYFVNKTNKQFIIYMTNSG